MIAQSAGRCRRVKTGCITCKKRKIKCDEARPSCNNCAKKQVRCDGYPELSQQRNHPVEIQPRITNTSQSSDLLFQLQLDPELNDFSSSVDIFCFREFISLVQGQWVSGHLHGDLWETIMPQLARASPCLRFAAMAVGAASMSASVGERPLHLVNEIWHSHASTYYGKSLQAQSQNLSIRTSIFLSLLLLFFELLRGQRCRALQHVNHGMALVLSVLMSEHSDTFVSKFAPNPRPILKDVAEVFTNLALQARTVLVGRIGDSTPLPNVSQGLTEKNLTMEGFISKLQGVCPPKADLDRIPTNFQSLDEFEEFWVAISLKQAGIRPRIMEKTYTSDILSLDDNEGLIKSFPTLLGNDEVRLFFADCQAIRDAIHIASIPLFNKTMLLKLKSPTRLRAIQLQLQFLGNYIFDNPPQYLDLKAMLALKPACQDYLALAKIALQILHCQPTSSIPLISIDCNIAWHLLLISLYCRDAETRERAVEMLHEYPGQDGLWNTQALHVLAEKNQLVETMNSMEGSPEDQWRRLWRREWVFEDGGKRVLFRFLDKDLSSSWLLVEEVALLQEDLGRVEWQRQVLGSEKLLLPQLLP